MEDNFNMPTLRFPEFTGDWERKIIRDYIISSAFGPRFSSEFYSTTGNVLTLRTTDMSNDGVIDYKNAPKANVNIEQLGEHLLRIHDLVISRSGTIGITAVFEGHKMPVIPGAFLIRFRFDIERISPKFIQLIFNSPKGRDKIEGLSAGGVQKNLTGTSVLNLDVLLPTLPEQTKIATFLAAIDEKLQALQKTKILLEQYKKGVMQQLFSQELRFQDENGQDFPNWEMKTLGEVLIKNSTKNKGQQYLLVQSVSNKYGFINQDEMFEDRRIASKDTSNYYVIGKGYFAYNPSRIDVGSLAYKSDDEISIISPLYISFRTNKVFLNDYFLLNWFSTEQFLMQMNNSFEGSVRNTLSYESLVRMEISFPNLAEQNKIASFLSAIDDKISQTTLQIQSTEQFKKGLLQKMFC